MANYVTVGTVVEEYSVYSTTVFCTIHPIAVFTLLSANSRIARRLVLVQALPKKRGMERRGEGSWVGGGGQRSTPDFSASKPGEAELGTLVDRSEDLKLTVALVISVPSKSCLLVIIASNVEESIS